ncbi:phosphopantetheine adenylyltransferase [Actinobacillus succinogenes]|uniref:Phosphopantetheine adenylyltransferase n=2 Tax=Pasteurellaceae TaxID=712 RepID=COAD_ACTSZ|nr:MULTISPECIES: pantetheine-phosphate adenylyltransferase [Pasteurellaceae]A6VM51.1 RecName: Full=Phosphopantetheine adenylyltransferase; AltName: Full=Dephospho-CoA pyrophosphorylase; AltName: Full=Pantetheine-phosphate adenylyltransferase; Short=PPAT [Actinobacillus succinogenes 130Z]ABR74048.1 pantetheine-phosphate adenylyltransferase [Actinobacillus succinogenes 130Z]MDG2941856.1 pantetheine-phosphate adenylyltransferase [Exercitatus varius]MDG2949828.1 pantetheine-phosphate adenylyltransf
MKTVIYPGTFDPITNGHLDIIERTAVLFPQVIVAVAASPTKKPLFDLQDRVQLAEESVAHLPNVRVIGFSGLLADAVKEHDITAIIRGMRTTMDFEYELQLAHLNRVLSQGVESLFLPSTEQWSYVSSTIVREIYLHNGNVDQFVPPPVLNALNRRRKADA